MKMREIVAMIDPKYNILSFILHGDLLLCSAGCEDCKVIEFNFIE